MPLARDFVRAFTSGYRMDIPGRALSRRTGVAQRGQRGGVGSTPPAPSDSEVTTPMPAVTDGAGFTSDGLDAAVPAGRDRARAIPEAAVARLAVYLRVLTAMQEQGVGSVSSEELSVAAGVNSAKLRKDLSYIGSYGTRGVGYEVEVLIDQIERILGLTRRHSVAVVGIGNLGHALANYGGFPGRGLPGAALVAGDPGLVWG